MAEGRPSVLVQAALRGGEHEGAGLDGAGADQHMPMGLAGLLGEGRGNGDELRACQRERAVELREAEVVADGEAEPAEGKVDDHRLAARPARGGLAVALASGEIDVEHMQLVVARGDLAFGIDQIRAVGDARRVELDGERADMQEDAELAGERAKPRERARSLLPSAPLAASAPA